MKKPNRNEETACKQWELLYSLIPEKEITDRAVLAFAAANELSDAQTVNLFEARAGVRPLLDTTVFQLCKKYPNTAKAWLEGTAAEDRPVEKTKLIGAWRLVDVKRYAEDEGKWVSDGGGEFLRPLDMVFSGNQVRETYHSYFIPFDYLLLQKPDESLLMWDNNIYRIEAISDDAMTLKSRYYRYRFDRIPVERVRGRANLSSVNAVDTSRDNWIVEAEYKLKDGAWQQVKDYARKPGLRGFVVVDNDVIHSYGFGRHLHTQGWYYKKENPTVYIDMHYYWLEEESQDAIWAYPLISGVDDYRYSKRKFRIVRKQPRMFPDTFDQLMWWAEVNTLCRTPVEKMPVDFLRACRTDDVEGTAALLAEGTLLGDPEKFRSTALVGAYVFLHHYLIRDRSYWGVKIDAATGFRQFQKMISRWLAAYDKGETTRCVYPFWIAKYAQTIDNLTSEPAKK